MPVTAGEEVALSRDDAEPEEVVVSSGCSGALPAPLHTQAEKLKHRAELVALAPV